MLLKLIIAGAVGYMVLAGMVWFNQRGMIYPASKYPSGEIPDELTRAGVEIVHLIPEEGIRLESWWFPPVDSEAPVILWFHGNGGDIRTRGHEALEWMRRGVGVFLLEYRGYGASTGEPSEAGFYRDAEAAWDHLTNERKISASRIVPFGRSMGGGIASWIALGKSPSALILESSFTSLVDRAKELYPYLPVNLLLKDRYPTLDRIPRIACPILIVHGTDDEVIDIHHSKELAKSRAEGITTHWVERAGHNNLVGTMGTRYHELIEQFIREHASNTQTNENRNPAAL